jgi:hypothetical protein
MSEIIFVVQEAPEGGFTADAVQCHFTEDQRPTMIGLRFVRER